MAKTKTKALKKTHTLSKRKLKGTKGGRSFFVNQAGKSF